MPSKLIEIFVLTSSRLGNSYFGQLKSLREDSIHVTEPLFLFLETMIMENLLQVERFTKSANWGRGTLIVSWIAAFFVLHIQFSQKIN